MKPVFVTALYDVAFHEVNPSRKSIEHYLASRTSAWTLTLRPLVVFAEEKVVTQLLRDDRNADILFVTRPLNKLHVSPHHSTTYLSRTPWKDTATHLQLQWEKFEMVAEVAVMMPHCDAFVWAAFGLGAVLRDVPENYPEQAALMLEYPASKFTCTVLNPVTAMEFNHRTWYYQQWRFRVAGGFWSIGRDILADFLRFVRKEIAWLRLENCCPTDEDIMGRFAYRFPHMCQFYFGDYASLVSNRLIPLMLYDPMVALRAIDKAQRTNPAYLEHTVNLPTLPETILAPGTNPLLPPTAQTQESVRDTLDNDTAVSLHPLPHDSSKHDHTPQQLYPPAP